MQKDNSEDKNNYITLYDEMKSSYMAYAMSVIVDRALPDVRDGFKPVHRRSLYAMHELGNAWNKQYKKSARIVGNVIGKYHPHGDTPVYDTIVRMTQPFSLRYPLIDGQGNFGSVDGDNPAAMRYTEVRIAKIGHEMLRDIDKSTVRFVNNYDDSELEPEVLPTRIPNLLLNGSSGIAVGMATNIPPHNLGETINACLALLDNPDIDIDGLMEHMPAPDFPTYGIIWGTSGIRDAYITGKGKLILRSEIHIEEMPGGRESIVIDSLPYKVNKRSLLEKIVELVTDKKILGISDIRDESDRDGMRVVIELKKGEFSDIIVNQLYKSTQIQDSFNINMVALVDKKPCVLNLKSILEYFLAHRVDIVVNRTNFDLKKNKSRSHILEGLAISVSNLDRVLELIRGSSSRTEAHKKLIEEEWNIDFVKDLLKQGNILESLNIDITKRTDCYYLSEIQAKAILDMQLGKLTGLEKQKIYDEYKSIILLIADLVSILNSKDRINNIIREELKLIIDEYKDVRRSKIVNNSPDIRIEDLIIDQEMVVTLSRDGYIKSQPVSDYRSQRRGGRGRVATGVKDKDFIDKVFTANSKDTTLSFTSLGRCYWLKVYELPQGGRYSRGKPVVNLFKLQQGEKISTIVPVSNFYEDKNVIMATAKGIIKKTALKEFSHPRNSGIISIKLDDGDQVIGVDITKGNSSVLLVSSTGKAVHFMESEVRRVGRSARGVRGIFLNDDSNIISMSTSETGSEDVFIVTEYGYGKRTPLDKYTMHSRGTRGIKAFKQTERNGSVVGASLVDDNSEIMLITSAGILIRLRVNEIRAMGRSTQGLHLINLDDSDTLVAIQNLSETYLNDGDD